MCTQIAPVDCPSCENLGAVCVKQNKKHKKACKTFGWNPINGCSVMCPEIIPEDCEACVKLGPHCVTGDLKEVCRGFGYNRNKNACKGTDLIHFR